MKTRKILALALAAALFSLPMADALGTAVSYQIGDVNCDGEVGAGDLTALARHICGLETLPETPVSERDIDTSEVINGKLVITYTDGTTFTAGNVLDKPTEGLAYTLLSDGTYGVAVGSAKGEEKIVIPSSYNDIAVTQIQSDGFIGCELTCLVLPKGLTAIGSGAFYDCDNLTGVTIPDTVTFIGSGAFSDCDNLAELVLGNGVVTIDEDAFYNCPNLEVLVWGSRIESVGDSAFGHCAKLTDITFADGLESIGATAFAQCTKLAEITLPDSLTTIGNLAFIDCMELNKITYTGTMESWNKIDKGIYWDYNTDEYTVCCTDGTIIWQEQED